MTTGPDRLRRLAEECRVIADNMQSLDLRQQVLPIAESYDGIAHLADERATREKPEP